MGAEIIAYVHGDSVTMSFNRGFMKWSRAKEPDSPPHAVHSTPPCSAPHLAPASRCAIDSGGGRLGSYAAGAPGSRVSRISRTWYRWRARTTW